MIEDWFSQLINVFEFAWEIMLPLWAYLILGSLLVTLLERIPRSLLPETSLNGALMGAISPLPTISLIALVKEGKKGNVAFIITSLLANPILLIMIWSNLGWGLSLTYLCLALLIGGLSSFFISALPDQTVAVTSLKKDWNLVERFWGHLAYIGSYTLIGVLIAAFLRVSLSWTLFNLNILGLIPEIIKGFIPLAAAPFYNCGGTWLPILRELNDLGISLGTVLGFILFGQVTRVGHLLALQTLFTRKSIIGLVAGVGVISLSLAYLF